MQVVIKDLRKTDPTNAEEMEVMFPEAAVIKAEDPDDQPPTLRKATAGLEEATKAQDKAAAKVARLGDELSRAKEDLTNRTESLQVASKQFQRATKDWEQSRAISGEPPPAAAAACIPDCVAENLDGDTKTEIEDWNRQALDFERKRREFFTKLFGAEWANRSASEACNEDAVPSSTLLLID